MQETVEAIKIKKILMVIQLIESSFEGMQNDWQHFFLF